LTLWGATATSRERRTRPGRADRGREHEHRLPWGIEAREAERARFDPVRP
jgi:hypothetical protein